MTVQYSLKTYFLFISLIPIAGITYLNGRTNYGDSIEDEWVVVYLLRELTKRHKDIWVKVRDGDGEFLLIEAAGTLPAWLEPEVADNRVSSNGRHFGKTSKADSTLLHSQVWINQGGLKIIKPKQTPGKKVTEKLSLPQARKIIQGEPDRFIKSTMIQEEAFYRLRNYPKQIFENLHSAIVTIPRKVAFLLHQKPGYISPAVEAFYVRDPIAMRPLRAKDASGLTFKPDDMVTVSVRFTRVGYAQVKSQEFPIPNTWAGILPPIDEEKAYARAETGMKIACGFEMLLYDPHHQDKAAVREMKLLLEDVETGDEELPTNEDIEKTWDKREDDEKWLDINFEDLDRELKGKGKGRSKEEGGNFGDAGAQENLQRIVARFDEFLNDTSAGFDGAEFDDFETDSEVDTEDDDDLSSDGEDKDASFNEEEFARMMKEMMGMPSASGEGPDLSTPLRNRIKELEAEDDEQDDELEQIQELSRQMEAELKRTGVLDLNGKQKKLSPEDDTSKGKGAEGGEGDDDENVNINLAKNILESLQGQAGTAGPAGNLLSMMGLHMPKDDRS